MEEERLRIHLDLASRKGPIETAPLDVRALCPVSAVCLPQYIAILDPDRAPAQRLRGT